MAKIPVIESTAKIQVPNTAQMPQLPPQTVDRTKSREMAESFAVLEGVAQKFKEAVVFNEKTKALTEAMSRTQELEIEAAENPEIQDISYFQDRMKKNRQETTGMIGLPSGQSEYQNEYDRLEINSLSRIQSILRTRTVSQGQEDLQTGLIKRGELFNESKDEAEMDRHQNEAYKLIDEATKKAFISPAARGIAKEKWRRKYQTDKIVHDIDINTFEASKQLNLKEAGIYGSFDSDIRIDGLTKAKAVAKYLANEGEVEAIRTQLTNQSQLDQDLVSGKIPPAKFLSTLENGVEFGIYDKDWAEQKKKALLSVVGIDLEGIDKFTSELELRIADVTEGYTKNKPKKRNWKTAQQYLREINKLAIKIEEGKSVGLLTRDEATALRAKIYGATTAEATQKAIKGRKFQWDIDDANAGFEKVLSDSDRYVAVRQYFLETDGKDLSDEEEKQIAADISDKVQLGARNFIMQQVDEQIEQAIKEVTEGLPSSKPNPQIKLQAKELGISLADIRDTAKANNITEQQVIDTLMNPEEVELPKVEAPKVKRQKLSINSPIKE